MKAVRLHRYEQRPVVEGQWADKSNVALPYTLGHERRLGPLGRLRGGAPEVGRRGDPAPAADLWLVSGLPCR